VLLNVNQIVVLLLSMDVFCEILVGVKMEITIASIPNYDNKRLKTSRSALQISISPSYCISIIFRRYFHFHQ
jgi:hypothetical protein